MRKDTQLKQQALMLKAAFEEGVRALDGVRPHTGGSLLQEITITSLWNNSTTKQMHDQLLMEVQSGLTTKS